MTAWPRPETYTWRMDDGAELTAAVWGFPADPPLLLAHDGDTDDMVTGLARALGDDGYYAVALDLRGRADAATHTPGDLIRVSLALPAVPVAIARGIAARAALQAASLQPEHRQTLFRGLIILEPAPKEFSLKIPVMFVNSVSAAVLSEVRHCLQRLHG